MILSWLERSFQDHSEAVKSIDRGQELIEFHLSEVSLLFDFSKAYFPRPPKEIVAHCHYSPASQHSKHKIHHDVGILRNSSSSSSSSKDTHVFQKHFSSAEQQDYIAMDGKIYIQP